MRDPKRLPIMYTMIGDIHKAINPDLRIGQFICNFLGWYTNKYGDPFFPEDDKMIERFEEYAKEVTGNDELFSD